MTAREEDDAGLRTVLLGMAINVVMAVVKVTTGIVGNSYALIADGIESISDVAISTVVYGGLRIAMAPPDRNHPYGHGRAEALASLFVSFALGAAALFILVQSAREIVAPQGPPAPYTLIVLVGVIVVKEVLFRRMRKVGDSLRSVAVGADAWHQRSDAITSAAAFLGIAIALLGGPGYEAADDWAAVFASGIIVYNAWRIGRPAIAEIMDAAPDEKLLKRVRSVAGEVAGVLDVEKCFVRKAGKIFFVDLHVMVDGDWTVREGHAIAHRVKDGLRAAIPEIGNVLVHVEPQE